MQRAAKPLYLGSIGNKPPGLFGSSGVQRNIKKAPPNILFIFFVSIQNVLYKVNSYFIKPRPDWAYEHCPAALPIEQQLALLATLTLRWVLAISSKLKRHRCPIRGPPAPLFPPCSAPGTTSLPGSSSCQSEGPLRLVAPMLRGKQTHLQLCTYIIYHIISMWSASRGVPNQTSRLRNYFNP